MLTRHDVAGLFQSMRTAYGNQWKHGPEAMNVWLEALKRHDANDIRKAANDALGHYVDYPPSLPQFLNIVRESTPHLPSPDYVDFARANRAYAYCRPQTKTNPQGNPHNVTLPESIARRAKGEPLKCYEKRIGIKVTLALYPNLRR